MKNLIVLLVTIFLFSCSSSNKDEVDAANSENKYLQSEASVEESDIAEVYYFHGTRRCATCKAVSRVSQGYTLVNYKDAIEKGLVKVKEVDFDQPGNEELVEKFQVTRSSLFVRTVKDKHESIYNLTEMAFMNAELHPEKIREAIKLEIEKVL